MKNLFLICGFTILNAMDNTKNNTNDDGIFIFIVLVISLSVFYGITILFKDFGKKVLIIPLIFFLYRGYVNYNNGGELIPINNLEHWIFNHMSIYEVIIWIVVFIIYPLKIAYGHKCNFCKSSKLKKINSKFIDCEVKKEGENLYNVKSYSNTYFCKSCSKESTFQEQIKIKI